MLSTRLMPLPRNWKSDFASGAAVQYQPRVLEYPAFADAFAKALADAEAGAAPSKRDAGVPGKASALRKVQNLMQGERQCSSSAVVTPSAEAGNCPGALQSCICLHVCQHLCSLTHDRLIGTDGMVCCVP